MPTWYTSVLALTLVTVILGLTFRHTYLHDKGKEPDLVMHWDGPEGAVAFLALSLLFLLVPAERWIGATGMLFPVFFVVRAMYRGIKFSNQPTFPTNPKETSWNL